MHDVYTAVQIPDLLNSSYARLAQEDEAYAEVRLAAMDPFSQVNPVGNRVDLSSTSRSEFFFITDKGYRLL